jgi:hypothetical protein
MGKKTDTHISSLRSLNLECLDLDSDDDVCTFDLDRDDDEVDG